jgi:hypothetical protein
MHGLCWIHAERSLRRLQGHTVEQCQNIDSMQQLLWDYYQQLKAYQQEPSLKFKAISQKQLGKFLNTFW